jgi:flagellar biosynthetic protein FlhB
MLLGPRLVGSLEMVMRDALTLDRSVVFDPAQLSARLTSGTEQALLGIAPLLLVVVAVALLAPTLLSGWLFTLESLQPDFARLNPLRGLARLFSWNGLIQLGKAVVKTLLIGGVATWVIWSERTEILLLISEPLNAALAHLAMLLGQNFLLIAGAFALVVAIDIPFQIWSHSRELRMTKEEVREELKETEGNPQIKARVRSLQREVARRRMMAEVPKADVIVTNPAHFAVALQYREPAMAAPRVVAKGSLLVAERIVGIAREAGVPILQAAPLARALFTHAEVGREIPPRLYTAVAEVLAWVYQLRRAEVGGGEAPRAPTDLPVPADLDPEAKSVAANQ